MNKNSLAGLTVAVTGANGKIGVELLPQLKALQAQTIALVRKDTELNGADQAISNWLDNPAALEAMRTADVIVHLCGELFAPKPDIYQSANVDTTKRVVTALSGGQVKRVISLSYIGADLTSSNLYLKTNGLREKLLLESGTPSVIFRCPAIINTPTEPDSTAEVLTAKGDKPVQMIGNGKQYWQPVYRGDVIAAIIAATQHGTPGVYDLVGPDVMSADELVYLINGNHNVKISHVPAPLARLLSRFLPALPPTYVDVVLRDALGNPNTVAQEFNLKLTPLSQIWP